MSKNSAHCIHHIIESKLLNHTRKKSANNSPNKLFGKLPHLLNLKIIKLNSTQKIDFHTIVLSLKTNTREYKCYYTVKY